MRLVWILLIIAAGSVAGFLFTRFESSAPLIQTRTGAVSVGSEHTHEFRVSDVGMGVERVHIWLQSGDTRVDLADESYAGGLLWGADLDMMRASLIQLPGASASCPYSMATSPATCLATCKPIWPIWPSALSGVTGG